jgi:hypothetical protein|nr:hypothetical protein [Neorhizobium tomejilense]
MRFSSFGIKITSSAIALFMLASQASALSMLGTGAASAEEGHAAPVPVTSESRSPAPAYLEKRMLVAVTEAMRINRDHRRMFSDLTGGGRRDTALTKYVRALDVRYSILSTLGDSLLKATTPDEAAEANAAAEAILAIRTDLDRAISVTQMAIIDSARLSKSYFGACNAKGELVDGTKCVRAEKETDGTLTQFWVQPWDADRFNLAKSPQ